LSSSYFEGSTCPLAKLGYSRDGKPGLPQVNYGVLTDGRGCPVAVSVYEGNVADSQTLLPAVRRLRADFGIEQLVLVGDRGMISNKAIAELRASDGIGWITALKSVSIRALVEQGQLQLGLFDERNLLELRSPDYPGERLVACRNPELARLRAYKREELLAATERNLEKIQARVVAGKLRGADAIGLRVGKVSNQYQVATHFDLTIDAARFQFARNAARIAAEAALDGLYLIRFLCLLAYYVEWHLREAWRELLFADPEPAAKAHRDPVAPAQRSAAALTKAARHTLDDGTPVHSFATLQQRAFDLLQTLTP
ncbi:MAG: transposase, partial [Burkholderiales bacterium]|nr:transposase [Burkholderiales bacterium]